MRTLLTHTRIPPPRFEEEATKIWSCEEEALKIQSLMYVVFFYLFNYYGLFYFKKIIMIIITNVSSCLILFEVRILLFVKYYGRRPSVLDLMVVYC